MTCSKVTPFLGVSMTNTAVVVGTAILGRAEAASSCDWDCAAKSTAALQEERGT